jgi:hypothetical protein
VVSMARLGVGGFPNGSARGPDVYTMTTITPMGGSV